MDFLRTHAKPVVARLISAVIPGTSMRLLLAAFWICAMSLMSPEPSRAEDLIAPFRAVREQYIAAFRTTGVQQTETLLRAEKGLAALATQNEGAVKAAALVELGTMQRLRGAYPLAIATLTEGARIAVEAGRSDLAFTAWIGVARAYAYGTKDHGAAAAAYQHAEDAATAPTRKQRADLAGYRAQLEAGRGELDAAMVDAAESGVLAETDEDRFYAALDLGDALQKKAESCDYRTLRDARSADDGANVYGACRRAVAAADAQYIQGHAIASRLGWTALAGQVLTLRRGLALRAQLLESRARMDSLQLSVAFSPHRAADVLIGQSFEAGASTLDQQAIASLIETVLGESEAREGRDDARGVYMRGLAADIRGLGPETGAASFARAAQALAAERGGYFDPSRRGTVIENRGEIVRDLALRLLSLGRQDEAFAAFESVRARGLGDVAAALNRPDVTDADREWLARLIRADAEASRFETRVAGRIVAGEDANAADFDRLAALRASRSAILAENPAARTRFAAEGAPPASLRDLRSASERSGIPVLLYWTTYANVVVWYVGPHGSEVRTVFLPESALNAKITRVRGSAADSSTPFDVVAARELYLFLLAPFADLLNDAPRIGIVPHGALGSLPFEALVDPATERPAMERWAFSYAPNATMAARFADPATVTRIAAVADILDEASGESEGIRRAGMEVSVFRPAAFGAATKAARDAGGLHVLVHGFFDDTEPLLSALSPSDDGAEPVYAADLLAWDLRGLRLAAFSACESGRAGARISGEIFGFPWALLAGGAQSIVLSRWLVDADANASWMQSFYQRVLRGDPPAIAAQAAMRAVRSMGNGRDHPYYWAAMQVTGN